MPPFKIDLTGQVFGHLYVRKYAGKAPRDGQTLWECRCYADGCYRILNVRGASLIHGWSKTCGCSSITHGFTRGPKGCEKPTEYRSWCHAKMRCVNPTSRAYKDYGGRGIRMCAGWLNDYAAFFKDMGPKPESTSLDRTDVNGHYSCGHCDECTKEGWPANCRWESGKVQGRHRRNNRVIEYDGEKKLLVEWAEELGVDYKIFHYRLSKYSIAAAMIMSQKK
jgi:hypothetical protein